MDRLVIETVLSDVNEIFLSKEAIGTGFTSAIVMGFKADHTEQILHAFAELKKVTEQHEIQLVICKTMMAGIYDLEICTDALDEPIRILNKAIPNETVGEIEDHINSGHRLLLSTNVSKEDNKIAITNIEIKSCEH